MKNKHFAEFIGTFWLVLGGCGTAVLATSQEMYGDHNVGFLGVALAFGLTVLTGAYALGPISGAHFNPAVSIGLWMGGRFSSKDLGGYILAQILGGIAAAGVLYIIATGNGADIGGFASNGYGSTSPAGFGSPGGYSLGAAFLTEFVMTACFLVVIMGATAKIASPGFAGIAIGLCLTLIHLISIPVTNTSVNPARSISQAIFAGGDALTQLWLFIVAPILGAIVGAVIYKNLIGNKDEG